MSQNVATLMTPGPVNLHPRVMEAMALPLRHHRTSEFCEVTARINQKLRPVFQTEGPVLTLAGSGTAAMEATVANLTSPGGRAVAIDSGKFGERWTKIAQAYGLDCRTIKVPWGESADPEIVARVLDEHRPDVLLATYCETSTGALHPIQELTQIAREHQVLTVVDAITGLIAHPLPMDEWGVDAVVGGSQKAMMLPPGLAFVALSPQAQEVCHRTTHSRFYLDLRAALAKEKSDDFPYTPAINLLMGLEASLTLFEEEGLPQVWGGFARRAGQTREGLQSLGLSIFPQHPSNSLTVVQVPEDIDGKKSLGWIEREHGIRLAGGQEHLKGRIWRFGHMGYLTEEDVERSLKAVAAALESPECKLR